MNRLLVVLLFVAAAALQLPGLAEASALSALPGSPAPAPTGGLLGASLDGPGDLGLPRGPHIPGRPDLGPYSLSQVSRERIKGGIKLGIGFGLIGAGAALSAQATYYIVTLALYGSLGYGYPQVGLFGPIVPGVMFGGAAACFVVGAILISQGRKHFKKARDPDLGGLGTPDSRAARSRISWGLRFGPSVPGVVDRG